jgi:glycine/D-amino acid oxidase-like deaminating enzyme
MLPGKLESYWIDSTPTIAYAPLEGEVEVDVAVIGGGIAGICTAWELTAVGRSVAVLEAGRILTGVTGYTTAKLSSLHTLIYAKISRALGQDAARLYAQSQQQASREPWNSPGNSASTAIWNGSAGSPTSSRRTVSSRSGMRSTQLARQGSMRRSSPTRDCRFPSPAPSAWRTRHSSIPGSTCSPSPRT